MSITAITKKQFTDFNIAAGAMALPIYNELEWYRDTAANIIGSLVMDKVDKDFCYVVLGRDQNGEFRAIDMEIEAGTISESREKLLNSMRRYEESGQTIFPQDE